MFLLIANTKSALSINTSNMFNKNTSIIQVYRRIMLLNLMGLN